jgi:hypothetical protein
MTQVKTDSTALPLRPLDRRTLHAATVPAIDQLPDIPRLPSQPQEQVSVLAQDAFISRSYELKNPATMGAGFDGAMRYMSAVANDMEGLSQPNLTVGTGIALTGKLVKDATGTAVNAGRVVEGLRMAHIGLVRSTKGYQASAAAMRTPLHAASQELQPMLTKVERVGAIGSLGMATIALPALAVSAVKHNAEAVRTLSDGKSTNRQRIVAIKDAAYTNAALAYTAIAVPSAIKTLSTTGAAASFTTRAALAAKKTGAYRTADRASGFITPLADATLLIADGLHLYTTMTTPSAKGTTKARAALNVGLDALKLGLYAFPRTRSVQLAYTAAGLAQFGFAIHDVIRPPKP